MGRTVFTFVLFQAFLVSSCGDSKDGGGQPELSDNLPGYGDDEIGFRNAGADDNGMGDADSNGGSPTTDEDGEYGGDVDTDSDTDTDTDTDTDSDEYLSNIDQSFLNDQDLDTSWYGMLYEGLIVASASELASLQLQNMTAGTLADQSLTRNPADLVVFEDGDALVSVSSLALNADTGQSVYVDSLVVESVFDKADLDTALGNESIGHGVPTLVLRNTFEIVEGDAEVLRASCIVASNQPQGEAGALPGEGLCYAPDGVLGISNFVSLAHKTPLTEDLIDVSEQYTDLFGVSHPQFGAAEDLCVCYDSDGTTPMSCAEFEENRSNPPPPEDEISENPFYTAAEMPTSTFAIDVDTGSYTLVRQHLSNNALPPTKSVRVEEMINYFKYNYKLPTGDDPFTIYTELADCPWKTGRKLAMIGMRGQQVAMDDQPAANLVYLLDVSGSMAEELWLIKPAFRMLTKQLRPQDTLSIVTYAGNEAVVIDGATGDDKEGILAALDQLKSGGSTNGAGGIQKAYELAEKHFKDGGNNRVILATDGDFNVGVSSDAGLVALITEKAASGVFLTVYGFNTWGMGDYKDTKMEQLANSGNGTYFFIDGEAEARRAFIHSLSGTLLTIAKDVKLQVQFNPNRVKGYRLIGYDNRVMNNDDFDDDTVDAGELGNAEDMTAFYELILADSAEEVPATDVEADPNADSETEYEALSADAFMAVRLRYKNPDSDTSELVTHPISSLHSAEEPSRKFVFAATVAELGLVLRQSAYIDSGDVSALDDRIQAAFAGSDSPAVDELLALLEKANAVLE